MSGSHLLQPHFRSPRNVLLEMHISGGTLLRHSQCAATLSPSAFSLICGYTSALHPLMHAYHTATAITQPQQHDRLACACPSDLGDTVTGLHAQWCTLWSSYTGLQQAVCTAWQSMLCPTSSTIHHNSGHGLLAGVASRQETEPNRP